MGLRRDYLKYIEDSALAVGGLTGKRMLEFGDQVLEPGIGPKTGKQYFESRGVKPFVYRRSRRCRT